MTNDATATGTPPVGADVTDDADASVAITTSPGIELTKSASDTTIEVGGTITYTYTVTNTGNVTLTGVTAVDDPLGSVDLGETELLPGESTSGILDHLCCSI